MEIKLHLKQGQQALEQLVSGISVTKIQLKLQHDDVYGLILGGQNIEVQPSGQEPLEIIVSLHGGSKSLTALTNGVKAQRIMLNKENSAYNLVVTRSIGMVRSEGQTPSVDLHVQQLGKLTGPLLADENLDTYLRQAIVKSQEQWNQGSPQGTQTAAERLREVVVQLQTYLDDMIYFWEGPDGEAAVGLHRGLNVILKEIDESIAHPLVYGQ